MRLHFQTLHLKTISTYNWYIIQYNCRFYHKRRFFIRQLPDISLFCTGQYTAFDLINAHTIFSQHYVD